MCWTTVFCFLTVAAAFAAPNAISTLPASKTVSFSNASAPITAAPGLCSTPAGWNSFAAGAPWNPFEPGENIQPTFLNNTGDSCDVCCWAVPIASQSWSWYSLKPTPVTVGTAVVVVDPKSNLTSTTTILYTTSIAVSGGNYAPSQWLNNGTYQASSLAAPKTATLKNLHGEYQTIVYPSHSYQIIDSQYWIGKIPVTQDGRTSCRTNDGRASSLPTPTNIPTQAVATADPADPNGVWWALTSAQNPPGWLDRDEIKSFFGDDLALSLYDSCSVPIAVAPETAVAIASFLLQTSTSYGTVAAPTSTAAPAATAHLQEPAETIIADPLTASQSSTVAASTPAEQTTTAKSSATQTSTSALLTSESSSTADTMPQQGTISDSSHDTSSEALSFTYQPSSSVENQSSPTVQGSSSVQSSPTVQSTSSEAASFTYQPSSSVESQSSPTVQGASSVQSSPTVQSTSSEAGSFTYQPSSSVESQSSPTVQGASSLQSSPAVEGSPTTPPSTTVPAAQQSGTTSTGSSGPNQPTQSTAGLESSGSANIGGLILSGLGATSSHVPGTSSVYSEAALGSPTQVTESSSNSPAPQGDSTAGKTDLPQDQSDTATASSAESAAPTSAHQSTSVHFSYLGTATIYGMDPATTHELTIGGSTVTQDSASRYAIGTQTLGPGSPALTISGTTFSLEVSGNAVVVDGQTSSIAGAQSSASSLTLPQITVAQSTAVDTSYLVGGASTAAAATLSSDFSGGAQNPSASLTTYTGGASTISWGSWVLVLTSAFLSMLIVF